MPVTANGGMYILIRSGRFLMASCGRTIGMQRFNTDCVGSTVTRMAPGLEKGILSTQEAIADIR